MSSVAFDKIVPFGQNFVLDDMPFALTLKEWVTLCLCLIDSSVDRCEYSKSCFGSCPGCQFTCLFNGGEDGSAPNSRDLREESVLYRIPLGAVRRVMGYSDVNAQPLGQLDKTPLELPAPCVVRASAVTEYEDALRIWVDVPEILLPLPGKAFTSKLGSVVANSEGHVTGVPLDIIDAIRHHLSIGESGIVVVVDLYGFSSPMVRSLSGSFSYRAFTSFKYFTESSFVFICAFMLRILISMASLANSLSPWQISA